MLGFIRLVRTLVITAALVGGGLALWQRRDQIKQLWGSLSDMQAGGAQGLLSSASKLVDSAGPIRDLVTQMANLKK